MLKNFICEYNQPISTVLKVINKNSKGICFVLRESKLVGVISDGDIRRGFLKGFNAESLADEVMNKNFFALNINSNEEKIRKSFSSKIRFLPLVDDNGNLKDLADSKKSHLIPLMEPSLQGNELDYVTDCIKTNWISSQGAYVQLFEKKFEDMYPGMRALAVSNGTVALHLALYAYGIGHDDEVIIPNITFVSTASSVLHCNAQPVFCEIDESSWCIDVKQVEKLITKKTKAIMPVHLYGNACNMDVLSDLADEYKLLLIEDCAEAIGTKWKKKLVGSFGDASTFSFFGNKTITTGEGGMVLFQNAKIAEKAKILRDHGMNPNKRYWHDVIGFNYRLTNLQSAIGVAQMERLSEILDKKKKIAQSYSNKLNKISSLVTLPEQNSNIFHSNWLYAVILKGNINRDHIIKELLNFGIDTRPIFYPLNLMPPFKSFRQSKKLDISLQISQQGLCLPSSISLKETEIDYIVGKLINIIKNNES
tara:strand:- start:33474 stop:34910 length:1437 start_codon:yes stop_codon:yes gene_type:complete